jgi:hypothetical protein
LELIVGAANAHAVEFVVKNTNDDGPDSLREAMNSHLGHHTTAQPSDNITFMGVQNSIELPSPLRPHHRPQQTIQSARAQM